MLSALKASLLFFQKAIKRRRTKERSSWFLTMDSVPSDFSERVMATWKCCDAVFRCECKLPAISRGKWSLPETIKVEFRIVPIAGTYCFRFRDDRTTMTMSELLQHPDLKKIRINSIYINFTNFMEGMTPVNDVGMQNLLNFVSFLANEPSVLFSDDDANGFVSAEGAMLLQWLEERWFTSLNFLTYHSIFDSIVRKQLSRRNPTGICDLCMKPELEIFADLLRSGQLTCFVSSIDIGSVFSDGFSGDVMEGIVRSFLRCPNKKKVEIVAGFDNSTNDHMEKLREQKLCEKIDGKFIFNNRVNRLEVSQHGRAWRCFSL